VIQGNLRDEHLLVFIGSKNVSINFFFHLFCGASTRSRVMAKPYGASRSHSLDTLHLVGPFWTSDQPVAETST